jgi:predicted permease
MSIFLITLPIFLIIFSGWLLKKFKVVSDDWVHILNNFAYYVSLPALIVGSFWEIGFSDYQSLRLIVWSLLIVVLFCLIVFVLLSFFKISKSLKAAIFLGATVGNTIYMGFPLVEIGFGKGFLPSAALIGVIFLIIPILIVIALIQYWYCREHCLRRELIGFCRNPLVISALVGVILSFIKADYPLIDGIRKSIVMLGATASPVALFALGAFMYKKFLKKDLGRVFLVSVLKMIVAPAIVLIGSLYFYNNGDLKILTFLAAMPVAVSTFVIAERFNLDKNLIGNSIIISTILSFVVAPLIIYLFR